MLKALFAEHSYVPLAYTTPTFPSLCWPINNENAVFLYHVKDIWLFTVYWSLILLGILYLASGIIASFTTRTYVGGLWILMVYLLIGAFHGLTVGTAVGLMYVKNLLNT